MKKFIIGIIIILVVVFCIFYFTTDTLKPTEPLNDLESSKLANESYLDILVDLEDFNENHYEKYKLLEVAMRIARELDLVKSKNEPYYLEFVSREAVHKIIEELTGIKIEEPIIEEDFYYLYDSDNDYYYIVPIGTDWIHYGQILSANKHGNLYLITCSGIRSDYDGGDETIYSNIEVKLHKRNDYKYVKYRLESISCN